jgi:hypothetical protein
MKQPPASLENTERGAPRKPGSSFAGRAGASLLGVKAVGSFVPQLTRKAFARYGFSTATLITEWDAIAGSDIGSCTVPERLTWPRGIEAREIADGERRPAATLVLRVDSARCLDVQYCARQIIERINAYFGYRAVSKLRLIQGIVPRPTRTFTCARSRPADANTLNISHVTDPGLRAALANLGARVRSRSPRLGATSPGSSVLPGPVHTASNLP